MTASRQERRQPAPDEHVLTGPRRRADDWMRMMRAWCRQRAKHKSGLAREIARHRHERKAHEEIRATLGLTIDEYRYARRWMDDAWDESGASHGTVTFDEALAAHEARQVELVSRFALLKQQGRSRDQIRVKLDLSHDGWQRTHEWYKEAIAATRAARDEAA